MDLHAKGINGQVHFDGTTITITRDGFLGMTTHGRSAKTLQARTIGAIQYKAATALLNGFIQFSVSGEYSKRNKLGSKNQDMARDENAVIFRKSAVEDFNTLVAAIREAQAGPNALVAGPPDVADQIGKLAALRDQGALTEDEFATKKAELLERL